MSSRQEEVFMQIQEFFDPETFTITYVVFDAASRDAVVIDPVLDYDVLASRTTTRSVERVAAFVRERELHVHYVLETHAHADHLSGSQWLKRHLRAQIAIGERIREVQESFRDVFDLPRLAIDGSQFDRLLADGEILTCGTLTIETIATPGHTPACVTYRVDDALFTGDALFMHDYGTGRCDFPRGSAEALYDSVMRLYAFPDATRVFPGHDYQPGGRAVAWETTIGRSKRENPQLRATTTKAEFVAMRTARDRMLQQPRLLYPSVQVNIDAGRLPPPHANGRRYLTIPISDAPPDERFPLGSLRPTDSPRDDGNAVRGAPRAEPGHSATREHLIEMAPFAAQQHGRDVVPAPRLRAARWQLGARSTAMAPPPLDAAERSEPAGEV
jgi:glyoxylase-like metal-dependent hydrolase (beta-lactamase superfamily II)